MHGTCLETPPQKIPMEDEPVIFSFFSDISANTEVIGLVQVIQSNIKNTLTSMTHHLTRWKRFRGIWKVDKVRDGFYVLGILSHSFENCFCDFIVTVDVFKLKLFSLRKLITTSVSKSSFCTCFYGVIAESL